MARQTKRLICRRHGRLSVLPLAKTGGLFARWDGAFCGDHHAGPAERANPTSSRLKRLHVQFVTVRTVESNAHTLLTGHIGDPYEPTLLHDGARPTVSEPPYLRVVTPFPYYTSAMPPVKRDQQRCARRFWRP